MNPDTVEYQREVYTIWDLFGDVGGLLEVTTIFGGFLMATVSALTGSNLDTYLLSKLFFVEKKRSTSKKVSRKTAILK